MQKLAGFALLVIYFPDLDRFPRVLKLSHTDYSSALQSPFGSGFAGLGLYADNLDFVFDARDGDDGFGPWETALNFCAEPFSGSIVAVDEEGFFRTDLDDVIHDRFTGGVATEIKNAGFAMQRHGRIGGV